jgi:hypothetical protein
MPVDRMSTVSLRRTDALEKTRTIAEHSRGSSGKYSL